MAFAFVKQTNLQKTAATSHVFSVTSTAGNFLVACLVVGGTASAFNTVGDSGGNTYAVQTSAQHTWAPEVVIATVGNAAAITSLTVGLLSSQMCSLSLLEFSGGVGNGGTATGNSGGSSSTAVSSLATGSNTAAVGNLALALVGWSATTAGVTVAASTGFTLCANLSGSSTLLGIGTAYEIATGAGALACTFAMGGGTSAYNGSGSLMAQAAATAALAGVAAAHTQGAAASLAATAALAGVVTARVQGAAAFPAAPGAALAGTIAIGACPPCPGAAAALVGAAVGTGAVAAVLTAPVAALSGIAAGAALVAAAAVREAQPLAGTAAAVAAVVGAIPAGGPGLAFYGAAAFGAAAYG